MHGSRRRKRFVAWAVGLMVVSACDEHVGCTPVLTTQDGQLELLDREVIAGACRPMRGRGPVVVGTRLCPRIDCGRDVPGCEIDDDTRLDPQDVAACFSLRVEGPATLEGACLEVIDAGVVEWHFTPRACPAQQVGYAPSADRLILPAVPPAELTAHLQSPGDAFALRELRSDRASGFPLDATPGPGRTVHVLADRPIPLAVVLQHPDHEEPVAWNPSVWSLEVVDNSGATPTTLWDPAGIATVSLGAGAEATLAVRNDDVSVEVGTVLGVAAADVTDLEIVVGYAPDEDGADGRGVPVGARVVGRRTDGTAVLGLEPQWEVTEGALPIWRDATSIAWGTDHVALIERDGRACHAPPKRSTTYRATLAARWGNLEAEETLQWQVDGESGLGRTLAELFDRDGYEDSVHCEGPGFPTEGCGGCRQGSPSATGALLLLGLVLRRRRSATPSAPH